MSRRFRLWEKKRGDRQTGSRLAGGLGEALFFGTLFLLGAALLTQVLVGAVSGATGARFWLTVLAHSALVLIGGLGAVYSVWQVTVSQERRSDLVQRAARMDLIRETVPPATAPDFPTLPGLEPFTNSPGTMLAFRLPTDQVRTWRLLSVLVFCLVWNAAAASLAVIAASGMRAGRPDWLLTAAAGGGIVVGMLAVRYFVRQMAIHTGLGPTNVEISHHPLIPGRPYELCVSQAGRVELRLLEVSLVCEEEATYHQGTDIRTECQTVFRHPVFRREQVRIAPSQPFEERATLVVPVHAMHSFQAPHNHVQWRIVVRGESAAWPPFERRFPVVVYPPPEEQA